MMGARLWSWRCCIVVAACLFAPRAALACPVCTGGEKAEVGKALFVGSVTLSILPLVAVGAFAWWLRRRARAIAASAEPGVALLERDALSTSRHPTHMGV